MAAPVETKVIASTTATIGVSVLLAVLNAVQGDAHLLGGLPVWLQTLLLVLVPPATTFAAGYRAAHTARPTGLPSVPGQS